jgi:hypothetical protein
MKGGNLMEEKRFLDDVDEPEEEQQQPEKQEKSPPSDWERWIHLAASLAAVTAITLLTFEMAVGAIKFGKIVAYAMGSSVLIGVLVILVIAFKYILAKFEAGLWRYALWAIGVPVAFLYYLLFVFLIYGQFAPFLVRVMGLAMANAP